MDVVPTAISGTGWIRLDISSIFGTNNTHGEETDLPADLGCMEIWSGCKFVFVKPLLMILISVSLLPVLPSSLPQLRIAAVPGENCGGNSIWTLLKCPELLLVFTFYIDSVSHWRRVSIELSGKLQIKYEQGKKCIGKCAATQIFWLATCLKPLLLSFECPPSLGLLSRCLSLPPPPSPCSSFSSSTTSSDCREEQLSSASIFHLITDSCDNYHVKTFEFNYIMLCNVQNLPIIFAYTELYWSWIN